MDIFAIMKAWFEFKAENPKLTSNHTDLLFYIIDLNNRLAWKEVIGLPSIETSQFLGMNYRAFLKTFDDLVELNLIRIVKKSKNQYVANQISIDVLCKILTGHSKSTYKAFIRAQQKQMHGTAHIDIHNIHINNNTIKQLKEENEFLKVEIENLKSEILKKENPENLNKAASIKKENRQEKKLEGGGEIDFLNFEHKDEYDPVLEEWLNYKKAKKESYKSAASVKAFYNKLFELSAGNIETAKKIVDQSMAMNWAGIFELKRQQKTNSSGSFIPVSQVDPNDPDRLKFKRG